MDNDLDLYYFHQGTNYFSYNYLGCNMQKGANQYKYTFRTWAPNAEYVKVVSDFVGWGSGIDMQRISEKGVWEVTYCSDVSLEGMAYKFKIKSKSGVRYKGDPYARFSKGYDDGASLICQETNFTWKDANWMNHRKALRQNTGGYLAFPINIYEVHAESFFKTENGKNLSYVELADILCEYTRSMGYTHVELMPITEYPFGGSWGYQVGGYFAPSSRFGTPDDFREFVDMMHRFGVGVIMDWVPAHFPKDEWGLYEFDGSPLYEYQGKDRQESSLWGTRYFDLGREEVQSFLISSALYFFREFHIDGLRVDAVASMIYLDYDRSNGEWIPNINGDNINLEACQFLKKLNEAVFAEFEEALMIAEESGNHGYITTPTSYGGLGFNLKWNMGWANDFYNYLSLSPQMRKGNHSALNFPIIYAFDENFCLPISHDEVVHGKRAFIDKIQGDYEEKFLEMRVALMYMMSFPGKKLTFMGTEFAQFREWDYQASLEWFMLKYDKHKDMQLFVRSLNHFYLSNRELWEIDFAESGFSWILPDEYEKCIVAYRRYASDGTSLVIILSFSECEQTVRLPVEDSCFVECIFASQLDNTRELTYQTKKDEHGSFIDIKIPKYTGFYLREKNNISYFEL